jgi:hypothetical protein
MRRQPVHRNIFSGMENLLQSANRLFENVMRVDF